MKGFRIAMVTLLCLTCGCASDRVVRVDRETDTENLTALSYKDFEKMAADTTDGMLKSGRFARNGNPFVLAIGRIVNDTCIHFDSSLLTVKVSETLTNSGQILVSSAVASDPAGTEQLIAATRALRSNAEFDAITIAGKGQLLAPDFALSGRIVQRNVRRDNGGIQVEYHYFFEVTDLKTGLQYWQFPGVIAKRVPPDWPVW